MTSEETWNDTDDIIANIIDDSNEAASVEATASVLNRQPSGNYLDPVAFSDGIEEISNDNTNEKAAVLGKSMFKKMVPSRLRLGLKRMSLSPASSPNLSPNQNLSPSACISANMNSSSSTEKEGYFDIISTPSPDPSISSSPPIPPSPLPVQQVTGISDPLSPTPHASRPQSLRAEDFTAMSRAETPLPPSIPTSPCQASRPQSLRAEEREDVAALYEKMRVEDEAFEATERRLEQSGWTSEADLDAIRQSRVAARRRWDERIEKACAASERMEQI